MHTLKLAVNPPLPLHVGDKRYSIEFPLAAVAQAEEKLGRQLKQPADWFCASAKEIPVLLRAGLLKNHPDIPDEDIAEICDHLNPESIASFAEAFGALAFPLFTAKWRENVNKLRAKGESPKAESADDL